MMSIFLCSGNDSLVARAESRVMVQPQAHVDTAVQWDMPGGEVLATGGQGSLGASSHGSLRVPQELASNEVVHRLVGDSHQLREALRRSNGALRERCEEMEGWQQRSREEREFLACRFRDARALVERLARENKALQLQLNHKGTSPPKEGQDMEQKPPEPIEGGNEILQLHKSHKEKLEEEMRELRRRNEELEKEREEAMREREGLCNTNAQLQAKLSLMQGCNVMEETAQRSASQPGGSDSSTLARLTEQLQATQCRYKELQEKLDCLQKTTDQRDRTEALLKQREKDFVQLAKDSEALKAQVTSLLGELNERQSCLDKSEEERKQVEEKLSVQTDELQCIRREEEQLKKQHSVTVDKLRLQTHNLEAALKTERLVLTEEKRKLAQLQHAYTQLFQDYDNKRKNESQAKHRGGDVEDLANRLVEAERALALKQDLIDKLKEEVEQQRGSLETVPVLTAQAEIYKADFRAEREAREKLHQRKEELQEQLNQALAELDRLRMEGTSRARMEEMQLRHLEDFRPIHPRNPPLAAGFPGATVPFNPAQPTSFRRHSVSEDVPDFRCPKCQYQAPDMDTLQIHVMDCIK
ncbi:hypothetical protein AAFF_G00392590 [Aldrovandia affinis]|uniref:NF-kappa-B essential modulator n=1 Tax=Aldrovandia affinis TaxID=143900 RepID=A0AAD7WLB0_9TELE|nr:hypothetical protein AAFF_G00392590 [Aldrovandia affinis]